MVALRRRVFEHRRNVLDGEHWQVGNYAFGARPDHPLLVDALDEAANRTLAAAGAPGDADVLRTTGPYMLSEVYHAGRRAGRYADVVLLRGDAEPRMGRATRGGADWHKFGSFAEHLLAHTWVTDARSRLQSDETYDDEASGDQGSYSTTRLVLGQAPAGDQGSYSHETSSLGGQGSYSYEASGDQGSYSYETSSAARPGLHGDQGSYETSSAGGQGSYSYETNSASFAPTSVPHLGAELRANVFFSHGGAELRANVRAYRYSDDRAADRPSVDRADRLACADEPFV